MLSRINGCLRVYQDRNIVLVGHGVPGDMAVLKDLGFDFQENRVVARLDTYLLARDLQMGHLSLENLLIKLNCPCNLKFHNAGNDANCALRALLLLGVKAIEALEGIEATSLGAKASSRGTSNRADLLWWVAMEELLSRKMKWCIQRKAARIRTPEEQVEPRAKRQQHRELYERTLSYTYGIIPENVSEAETT
ncbi:hypothetical protein BKA61DRAFT_721797 [Leptodontidium sp. MPI-SDFR-AT-0119]|nr:hypothetical protein BKA61DRAFT_721797 [Leptodontidium sp. MPI-SDFR-AT-0119]